MDYNKTTVRLPCEPKYNDKEDIWRDSHPKQYGDGALNDKGLLSYILFSVVNKNIMKTIRKKRIFYMYTHTYTVRAVVHVTQLCTLRE